MNARTLESCRLLRPLALPAVLLVAYLGCVTTYSVKLTGLSVDPPSPSIAATTTQQFTATGTFSDESSREVTAEVSWSSSDPTVATVDAAGLATPLKAGTVTITASMQGKSAGATLTVTNAQLVSVEVTCPPPGSLTIPNGTSVQLAAVGHFDDYTQQTLTAQATWESSNASVTVGNAAGSKGYVTSTALGATTATITATVQAIPGSATVTVNALTLSSVAVTPANPTIKVAQFQQFAATGTFSDLTTHDMTREVTWQSSDQGIATVNAAGRAAGLFAGSTTITATSNALLGSVSGSTQLTVETSGGGY